MLVAIYILRCRTKCPAIRVSAPLGIFVSGSHLWKVLMVKPITANETQSFEVSLREEETEKATKWAESSRMKRARGKQGDTFHPPNRSILQHELQGDIAAFVVLDQLSRLPHLLCIGDPHPSTLEDNVRE